MQLVAPSGNFAALKAAVHNGADAVYLGMPQFGARAKAQNFGYDEFASAVEYAHLFGTKVFVTLNTLIKDGEMQAALDAAKHAYEHGADAAIVQDIRFIKLLKRELPELTLHASTQMGIHNADGARAVLDMGISRAVLARETLPEDIAEIKKTGIDIEFFVQGALCICFSGNCYFSSLASSYSGNRGKCMQLCRKKYDFHGKSGYFLSAKDICLYGKLDRLNELGVDAIKIEGRMRSAEYVARAVSVYKSNMPKDAAEKALKTVFNRGDYCSAYFDKDAPHKIIYSGAQSNIGVYIGRIGGIKGHNVTVDGFTPHADDGFKIMRCGSEIGGASVRGGCIVADCAAKTGDELRRTFDGKQSELLLSTERKIPVSVDVSLMLGKPPTVKASADGVCVAVDGETPPQHATGRGITASDVVRAFEKTAEHPFAPKIQADIKDGVFMPVSELNALRRAAYAELNSALVKRLPVRQRQQPFALEHRYFDGNGVILAVDDTAAITEEIAARVDYIALSPRDYTLVKRMPTDVGKPMLLEMPITMRGQDKDILRAAAALECFVGVISNNYYTFGLTDKPILLGTGHNIIGECDIPHICSFEADRITQNGFAYAFGYAPMMTLCHCPYDKCVNCSGEDALTDEQGRRFKLRRYKAAHCYWRLLNCVPHDLSSSADKHIKNKYYDCSGMTAEEILHVLDGTYSGGRTRGNLSRGLK